MRSTPPGCTNSGPFNGDRSISPSVPRTRNSSRTTRECQRTSTTPAHAAFVLDHHRGVVLHFERLHQGREVPHRADGLAEQVVHQVDAVRRDVAQRPAAGLLRVGQPGARGARRVEPIVRRGFGKHRPADGAGFDQLARAVHLGIHAPVVGDAQGAPRVFGCPLHGERLGIIQRHGLFAEHVTPGAQRPRWSARHAETRVLRRRPPWRRTLPARRSDRPTTARRTVRPWPGRASRFPQAGSAAPRELPAARACA